MAKRSKKAALREALLQVKLLVDEASANGTFTAERDEHSVQLCDEYRGYDTCPEPGCGASIESTSWTVKGSGAKVEIWELLLHYAEAEHPIGAEQISEENQKNLLKIFGL